MSRRWSVDPDVEDELRALIALGNSPPRALERLASEDEYRARLPSRSTAYRLARELRRDGKPGERWSWTQGDPDEVRLVLPVLAAVGEGLGSLTRETAAWIVRVRRVVPSLTPHDAFLWAVRYQAAAGRDTTALDQRFARAVSLPASPSSS